jgi:hypothetical protein
MTELTFEELAKVKKGTAHVKLSYKGLDGLILSSNVALSAYIGIPKWHPLAGTNYDRLPYLGVHGGWTFGNVGDGEWRPADKYWFGWDYAHLGDTCFYDLEYHFSSSVDSHGWTVPEVEKELVDVMKKFVWLYWFGWIRIYIKRWFRKVGN